MDWDMKIPSWDLSELERDTEPNIGSVVTGSSGGGPFRQNSGMDCSVDLKLGGLGDFGSSSRGREQPRISTATVSPPGPSKRARTPGNGSQNVSCLVDGCQSDLSNCRDYHRRHKVCEAHSKTPMVLVGGQEQRFCQQCSRFHLLVEFDEVKRSCRKRLDGHNRRRRKQQPEAMHSGVMPTNLQGPRFSSYPHMYPSAAPDPTWTSVVKNEEDNLNRLHPPLNFIDRPQHFLDSYPRSYREGKQFPFLQCNVAPTISNRAALETSVCQPLLSTLSFSESSNNSGKMFSDGLSHVLDSDCALSLLSSPTQTPGVNVNSIVSSDRIPIAQPLVQNLHHFGGLGLYSGSQSSHNVSPTGFSCSGMGDEQVSTVLVSDASNAGFHCPSIFHVGGGGSSNGPPSNVLPFSWQ